MLLKIVNKFSVNAVFFPLQILYAHEFGFLLTASWRNTSAYKGCNLLASQPANCQLLGTVATEANLFLHQINFKEWKTNHDDPSLDIHSLAIKISSIESSSCKINN